MYLTEPSRIFRTIYFFVSWFYFFEAFSQSYENQFFRKKGTFWYFYDISEPSYNKYCISEYMNRRDQIFSRTFFSSKYFFIFFEYFMNYNFFNKTVLFFYEAIFSSFKYIYIIIWINLLNDEIFYDILNFFCS